MSWVVPRTASDVKTSIATDWPNFIAKVRAAKNMPSRFSPVMIASSSATSATIDCGMIPRSAIGKAAMTTIMMPGTIPFSGRTPISAVTT